jgi:hypothetical protein
MCLTTIGSHWIIIITAINEHLARIFNYSFPLTHYFPVQDELPHEVFKHALCFGIRSFFELTSSFDVPHSKREVSEQITIKHLPIPTLIRQLFKFQCTDITTGCG